MHTSVDIAETTTQLCDAARPKVSSLAVVTQSPQPARPVDHLLMAQQCGPGSKLSSPSPVSPVALCKLLTGYDVNLAAYLVHGFTYGFRIGCIGLPPQHQGVVHNLKSSDEFSEVIDSKIAKELALGRIMGPYDAPPLYSNYRVSPLGVVPKKAPGEFRMIHHLSHPEGS